MPFSRNALSLIVTLLGAGALVACAENERGPWVPVADTTFTPVDFDPCARPNTGCACSAEGEVAECGSVVTRHDDYVTCSMGTRTCSDGVWGECLGARRTQETSGAAGGSLRVQALGTSAACPADFDDCDPYCNQVVDTPVGFAPGDGFATEDDGLTLARTNSSVPCTSLTITPSASSISVTKLSPVSVPVDLQVTAYPAECQSGPFATTWTVDKVDRASITGSTSTDGVVTLAAPIAGTLRVTAFAQGSSTYVDIPVTVKVEDNTSALSTSPKNLAATSTHMSSFTGAGSASSTVSWLYPYEDTYFPLGLLAPTVQYSYTTTTGNGKAVRVSLRYPSGKNYGDPGIEFNYSFIVKESNVVAASAGVAANVLDPQVVIPQAAWEAFERTARGGDADLVVQRLASSLEVESRRRIHFVDGQLKGTVYYNSYNSTIGGSTKTNVFGAVLKIRPEDTQPTNAVPYVSGTSKHGLKTDGVCTVCHNVSANGSTLAFMSGYTNGPGCYNSSASSGNYRGNSCAFTLDAAGGVTYINTYRADISTQKYRFTWGAPYPDGSFYLTNAWDNVESYESASGLVRTSDAATLSATGVPPLAVTPVFSADGKAVAYNDGTDGKVVLSEYNPCRKANGSTSGEFVEIRNDSLVTVDIGDWTVQSASGGTCFTIASGTTLASGASKLLEKGTGCLNDKKDTLNLVDASGELRSTRDYSFSSNCKYREYFSCPTGSWSSSTTMAESSANDSCTIGATNDVSTSKLKVRDFSCGAGAGSVTCTGSRVFSNERTVVDCTETGCETAGNPSFLPDGRGLLYQHVAVSPTTSAEYGGATGVASRLNTWQGAQAEIWMTNADQSPSWSPRRLSRLNGLTTAGSNYLPLEPRITSAPAGYDNKFHDGSLGASGWVYDRCSKNSPLISATVNENRLNYLPTVAPQEAGGKYWVIFTSRRLYGSVATSSPWQAERSNNSSDLFGKFTSATASCDGLDQYSPGSGLIETKKLWIAAIDKNWESSGTDPSYPAFYLPGQELEAGNSHGFWVSDACAELGQSCETNDDCCLGTGDDPQRQCKVVSTATVPATRRCAEINSCSDTGESCGTTNDCCAGLTCPEGGGVCVYVAPVAYHPQRLTREYEASCPEGTQVEWRFFEWKASIPQGTSIAFSIQAKAGADADALPATPLLMSTALPPADPEKNESEIWFRGESMAGQLLAASVPELEHAPIIVVTMDFYPDEDGQIAPKLHGWQQVFDCVPAE